MTHLTITPVRLLSGHTSAETAYVVDDYPFGFTLRCRIRYWVETGTRGVTKGQQRFVSQTTNPRKPGEPWNRPKASTYASLVVMYLNEDDHVKSFHVSYLSPEGDARFRLLGLYEQIEESTRARYDLFLRAAQGATDSWDRFEETVTALAEHIREHGAAPEFDADSWAWTAPDGRRFSIPDYTRDVYLTLAHQRAEGKA